MTKRRFCPVHEYDRAECSIECVALRQEFERISGALRVYWIQRRTNRVVDVAALRKRCPFCHKRFMATRPYQLYCTPQCCRRAEHLRRVDERVTGVAA